MTITIIFQNNSILFLALDITVKSIDMKRFKIYWNNTVEINLVADFDTLEEAKAYCEGNIKEYVF